MDSTADRSGWFADTRLRPESLIVGLARPSTKNATRTGERLDKLRSIEYFMRVAEAGSLAASAHVLEVSPSSVSKVITAFEKALGFTLFHRSTRRLSLTANGAAYLEECRQILRDLEEAETHGRQNRGTPSGTVKVWDASSVPGTRSLPKSRMSSINIRRFASRPECPTRPRCFSTKDSIC
jgi:molybdenum-dependent DNA-binding transcriptional regulator ModE